MPQSQIALGGLVAFCRFVLMAPEPHKAQPISSQLMLIEKEENNEFCNSTTGTKRRCK